MVRWVAIAIGLMIAFGAASSETDAGLIADDGADGPAQRLKALVTAYWEAELRADPLNATFTGDHRADDRLPDLSIASFEADFPRYRAALAALDAIDARALTVDERMERDLFALTLSRKLEAAPFRFYLTPITHLAGLHLDFAESATFHPHDTVGDVENYLRRLHAFPKAVDSLIALMRRGMAEGSVPPRVTIAKALVQVRTLAASRAELSPLWAIVASFPADWPEADRRGLADRVRAAIEADVTPAYARLAAFLEEDYLPACRETVGLWDSPDGAARYAYRVRLYTTTDLTPDQVHDLGLTEVAKAREAMDAIRRQVGYAGDLKAFFAYMREDPKWRNASETAILARYREILREVEAKLPKLFGHLPRTDVVLKPVESYRALTASSGSYSSAPADGSRPGIFHVNTFDPTNRPTYTMQALAYHEALPGHHIQLSLAHEAPGRSPFRGHGYFPAFSEGWALYCEGLPAEIGLYTDPYSEFGRLELDAWRSARLVVDTGLHHKRWTRDQAIAYLEAISTSTRPQVEREVDRYIAWPAQALAYKIGELKIREIRARAERRLGSAFDLRAFHDRLLSQGSLPLTLLDRLMDDEPGPAFARQK